MLLQLSEETSKILFCCLFVFSALNLKVAYDVGKRNRVLEEVLSLFSYCALIVFLGWRTKGIDHAVYYEWFANADYWLIKSYKGSPEPLFALLTLFAKYVLNNFQFIYIFASVIYIFGLRKFINTYMKDSYIALFFMNISLYLYMCGLVRISIAIGIMMYAYTKIENKYIYFIFVFIASMFHYSALVTILIYFAYHSKKSIAFKNIIIVGIAFAFMSWFVDKYQGILPYAIMRYAGYLQADFRITNLIGVVVVLPAIVLWGIYRKSYSTIIKNDKGIDNVVKLLLVMVIISLIYSGTFRFTFYFFVFATMIYSKFINVLYAGKQRVLVVAYTTLFTLVGLVYVYVVYFNSQYIAPNILPIELNF